MRDYTPVSIEVISDTVIDVTFLFRGKTVTSSFKANWIDGGKHVSFGCKDVNYQYFLREDPLLQKFDFAVGDILSLNKLVESTSDGVSIAKIDFLNQVNGKQFFQIQFKGRSKETVACELSSSGELIVDECTQRTASIYSVEAQKLLEAILNDFKNASKSLERTE